MPRRFNRGNRLRPVNRIKHVIDKQSAITAGTAETTTLIVANDNPVITTPAQVETGCTVNGIYLHVEVNATSSAALANCYMYVAKNPGNNLTLPAPNVVSVDDNKKYVIHQEMVMLQKNQNIAAAELGGNPRTLFNGVIVIPRGYRRFGPSDTLVIDILAPGVNLEYCYQAHFKEFR